MPQLYQPAGCWQINRTHLAHCSQSVLQLPQQLLKPPHSTHDTALQDHRHNATCSKQEWQSNCSQLHSSSRRDTV